MWFFEMLLSYIKEKNEQTAERNPKDIEALENNIYTCILLLTSNNLIHVM